MELIAAGLAVNRALASLDLRDNAVGDGGALALAEALHDNASLAELQLDNNCIGVCMCVEEVGSGVLGLLGH